VIKYATKLTAATINMLQRASHGRNSSIRGALTHDTRAVHVHTQTHDHYTTDDVVVDSEQLKEGQGRSQTTTLPLVLLS